MEEPAETKSSYTLNHDENDASKPESFALLSEENAPMLENPSEEKAKGKSTEILTEPNEKTAEKKETIQDEKDVTQTNLPAKNRFLRFFDRKTNKNEPTEQNGNGVNVQSEASEGVAQNAPKRRFIPAIKLQNPFARKNENAPPADKEEVVEKEEIAETEIPLVENDDKKGN
jgi:hypothetical protein